VSDKNVYQLMKVDDGKHDGPSDGELFMHAFQVKKWEHIHFLILFLTQSHKFCECRI